MEDYKLFKLSTYKETSMHILISLTTWLISINLSYPKGFKIQKLYFYAALLYLMMQIFIIFNDHMQSENTIKEHLAKYKIYYLIMSIAQGLSLNYIFQLLQFSVTYFILTIIGCVFALLLIMILLPLHEMPYYPNNKYLNTFLTIMIPNILGLILINYYVNSKIIYNIIYFTTVPLFFISNIYLYMYNLNTYMMKVFNKDNSLEVNTFKFLINSYFYSGYLLFIYYAIPLAKLMIKQL